MSEPVRMLQWRLLRSLLEEVSERNLFQRSRWDLSSGLPESLEDFVARVSRTQKSELVADQAAFPPFGRNLTFAAEQYPHFCQTSGTTSRPLAVLDTEGSWEWLLGNWQRGYALAGVHPGMTAFFAFSFGPFLGFWTAFEAGKRWGLRCLPGGGLTSVARLHAMLLYGAQVLCCTPTYALHLAEVARSEGVSLDKTAVRRILVAGEPGGSLPAVRAQLEAAWPGSEVVDHYGMTEVGPVAFAEQGRPGSLRVLEDRYFAEILDPQTGAPVEEGALGELVLTPLGRSAWPLLRYQTGDLVRAARIDGHLELVGGILGRADDMVIVRGVNLYPGAVEQVVRSFSEVGEYRVTVWRENSMAEVSVEVEQVREGEGVCDALEKAFEVAFALRIPVSRVNAGTLPRFDMKARRWVVQGAR